MLFKHRDIGQKKNSFIEDNCLESSDKKSTSLYFPNTDTDEESRSQLLTSESIAETRRAETMNRLNRLGTGEGSRNLTNPLFDSMGSLDQPWSRGYGQTVVLSPPKISLPVQHQQHQHHQQTTEHETASTIQDIQHSIRLPVPRSSNILHGGYCPLPSTHCGSSVRNAYGEDGGGGGGGNSSNMKKSKRKICLPCLRGVDQVESTANLYSSTDELDSTDDLNRSDRASHHRHRLNNREQQQQQPYIICLAIVFGLLDILLLIGLTLLIFFFNCSADGWLYMDPRIKSICVTLWADWIPLYQRKFQCPDLPPGYSDIANTEAGSSTGGVSGGVSETNNELKPLLERINMANRQQVPSSYSTMTTPNPLSLMARYQSERTNQVNRVNPQYWDGDLGLMLPPKLIIPSAEQHLYGPRDNVHLYGRNYPTDKDFVQGIKSDQWLQLSQSQADIYRHMTISSIVTGSIIIPVIVICFAEISFYFFNCCQMCLSRNNLKPWATMKFFGRLYRLLITYIFGLLATMLLVWLIKVSVGRLRPDFIQICRPSVNACPKWYTLIQKTRESVDERSAIESDPRLLDLIVAQLAKQGKYLVTVATTPSQESSGRQIPDGLLSNADCLENNILKLKDARTSFPSLGASVSMYAAIFVTVYVTALMKNFRDACLCIPFLSLLGVSLVALLLGINRVIYRNNWFEDVLAGWIIGICVAIYVSFKVLYNRDKLSDLTNHDLNRRLHKIQSLLQTHNDYKQSELKMMKYL
ncbi:unnamed protein product [Heterobilharzia americana]|nr:unnamed protein product [Heterobilharzia americana]